MASKSAVPTPRAGDRNLNLQINRLISRVAQLEQQIATLRAQVNSRQSSNTNGTT